MDPNSDRIDEHLDDWAEWERKLGISPSQVDPINVIKAGRDALKAAEEVIASLHRLVDYWEVRCRLAEQERDQYIDATNRVLGLGAYKEKWHVNQ